MECLWGVSDGGWRALPPEFSVGKARSGGSGVCLLGFGALCLRSLM